MRNLTAVRVFGRDAGRRARFAKEMATKLKLPVNPADSAEQAMRNADIVVTATTAHRPSSKARGSRPAPTSTPSAQIFRRNASWMTPPSAAPRASSLILSSRQKWKRAI